MLWAAVSLSPAAAPAATAETISTIGSGSIWANYEAPNSRRPSADLTCILGAHASVRAAQELERRDGANDVVDFVEIGHIAHDRFAPPIRSSGSLIADRLSLGAVASMTATGSARTSS